jgi:DNA-binding NarL/FixJ family response regulator
MPVMNGLETTSVILKNSPSTKIIAWTIFDSEEYIVAMIKLGVKSFLNKNNDEELFKAIRIVHSGGVYLPDQIAMKIKSFLEKQHVEPCPLNLSDFERILVKVICKGFSSSKIGELIGKSPRKIEDYRNSLYDKFQVINKEQFIVKATKWDLV